MSAFDWRRARRLAGELLLFIVIVAGIQAWRARDLLPADERTVAPAFALNDLDGRPWTLSFSYGRALQDEALHAWHGKHENLQAGQRVFSHRAKCVTAAALGTYTKAMEGELARA